MRGKNDRRKRRDGQENFAGITSRTRANCAPRLADSVSRVYNIISIFVEEQYGQLDEF